MVQSSQHYIVAKTAKILPLLYDVHYGGNDEVVKYIEKEHGCVIDAVYQEDDYESTFLEHGGQFVDDRKHIILLRAKPINGDSKRVFYFIANISKLD